MDSVEIQNQRKKRRISHQTHQTSEGSPSTICKTCLFCRSRKTKCDGVRPQCSSCVRLNHQCSYPEDGRRLHRPSRAELEALEANLASLQKLVRSESLPSAQDDSPSGPDGSGHGRPSIIEMTEANARRTSQTARYSPASDEMDPSAPPEVVQATAHGPSPTEVHIAGAVTGAQDGAVQVHGVSSMFHDPGKVFPRSKPHHSTSRAEKDLQNNISRARLVANAALQRQKEALALRSSNISQRIELDGLDPEMATHLLEMHFNRQHYSFLISYRPATFDSLMNDGPYANKLLLNAIYYSSSVLSDRPELRSDPDDPQTAGHYFYRRFKTLLVDEIDKPTIPTAAGLLLCGATLVSHGQPSAGWALCGLAYRMIIDLGCHLLIDGSRKDKTEETALLTDLDLEIRKRLYWGAFMTDATQALYFGRPPTLRSSQARVPLALLDTYEELEDWVPYLDPQHPGHMDGFAGYAPKPAYAVSVHCAMVRLLEISARIVNTFYSIKSIRTSTYHIKETKRSVSRDLEEWEGSLPDHLRMPPDTDKTPPPHQLTILTTYQALLIILQRPFLTNGHLSKHSSPSERRTGERICIDAALEIWRLIENYRRTFTLRRAPYLVSYAVYSAVVAVLNQTLMDKSRFTDCMRFFWSALMDLQRGANFGLKKPLEVVKNMMEQFGNDITTQPDESTQQQVTQVTSTNKLLDMDISDTAQAHATNLGPPQATEQTTEWDAFAEMDQDFLASAMEGADWPLDDALFGLFAQD